MQKCFTLFSCSVCSVINCSQWHSMAYFVEFFCIIIYMISIIRIIQRSHFLFYSRTMMTILRMACFIITIIIAVNWSHSLEANQKSRNEKSMVRFNKSFYLLIRFVYAKSSSTTSQTDNINGIRFFATSNTNCSQNWEIMVLL